MESFGERLTGPSDRGFLKPFFIESFVETFCLAILGRLSAQFVFMRPECLQDARRADNKKIKRMKRAKLKSEIEPYRTDHNRIKWHDTI